MPAEPMKRSRSISLAGGTRNVFPKAPAKVVSRANGENDQTRRRIVGASSPQANRTLLHLGNSKARFAFSAVKKNKNSPNGIRSGIVRIAEFWLLLLWRVWK